MGHANGLLAHCAKRRSVAPSLMARPLSVKGFVLGRGGKASEHVFTPFHLAKLIGSYGLQKAVK